MAINGIGDRKADFDLFDMTSNENWVVSLTVKIKTNLQKRKPLESYKILNADY